MFVFKRGSSVVFLPREQAMQAYANAISEGVPKSSLELRPIQYNEAFIGFNDESASARVNNSSFYDEQFMDKDPTYIQRMIDWFDETGQQVSHQGNLGLQIEDLEEWDGSNGTDHESTTEQMNPPTNGGGRAPITSSKPLRVYEDAKRLRTVSSGMNSSVARQRIEEHDALLKRVGLHRPMRSSSTGELLTAGGYKPGDVTLTSATNRLATARRAWEEQPLVEDGLGFIQGTVEREKREDIVLPVSELWFRDDGSLVTPEMDLPMEPAGFKSFLSHAHRHIEYTDSMGKEKHRQVPAFPGAFSFLVTLPLEERIHIMNLVLKRCGGVFKLRTRVNDDGNRGVFAVVTPKYAAFDADRVAERIGNAVSGLGYRGEVTYDTVTTNMRLDATYHADHNITDFAAGDVFKVGLRGKSNDAGGGAIKFGPTAWWNGCLNMIIISNDESLVRLVHKGSMERIDGMFSEQIAKARPVFEQFAQQWGVLSHTPMLGVPLWGERYSNVEDVFEAVAKFLGQQAKKSIKVEHLLNSYDTQDEKDTLQAVVNAATRMAHQAEKKGQKLLDDIQRDAMERASGKLVKVLARQVANA